MEILGKLFGTETKVKVIRLFLFNPETVFDVPSIASRVKEDPARVRRELATLEKATFLKRKAKKQTGKASANGFVLNTGFLYLSSLQNLLISSQPLQPKEIIKKISSLGTIKLIIIAGVFIQDADSRADILIVGDNIKKGQLANVIKNLEAEIGKELRYAHFTTVDFTYRLSMYDKLIRDILDYPHEKLVNKLPLL